MSKELTFREEGMKKMLAGLNKAANAVGGTLGPKGLNVFIDDNLTPKITNDGATIADKIVFEDKLENAGAYIIRNTSSQTNDDAGDGTTTTAVLTQAIINECVKRPENPMVIKDSLKEAGRVILGKLAKRSQKIEDKDIEKVALISAENRELAQLITKIVQKLGKDAVINVEDSKTFGSEFEIVDGYEAHVGFISPHFITDKKSARAIYNDIPVLVTEKKIDNVRDITPIFELFKKEGINSCVFVCDDIDDSMLGILVANKAIGNFNSLVVRANAWLLKDIEGAVGATAISPTSGVTFQNFNLKHLGRAKKVVCDANKTLFTTDGVAAKKYAINLESQLENEPNMYTARSLKQRIAKMKGGIAVLRIGAPTDFERDYLRLKAEDAVKAVQCALAEGVVEGGGLALWRISQEMKPKTVGERILKIAIQAPFRRILENAGVDYTEVVMGMPQEMGYDAKSDDYVNMFEAGIIDPTKVERVALENSVSSASTFITTNVTITEYVKETDRGTGNT